MSGEFGEPVSFIEWFDVNNKTHLDAYRHLIETGCWPKGFIREAHKPQPGWQYALMAKLSSAYLDNALDGLNPEAIGNLISEVENIRDLVDRNLLLHGHEGRDAMFRLSTSLSVAPKQAPALDR